MYQLNKFCNIIFELRKERGLTQTMLAEMIGIAPQSISKWECGVGYPDVTLFPIIAELFDVPIGVLFGETQEDNKMKNNLKYERKITFEALNNIEIKVANLCRIEIIDGAHHDPQLNILGDSIFIEYFSVMIENGNLQINIKNPTGSDTAWNPYDRGDYHKPNLIQIYTGVEDSDCTVVNYLDLVLEQIRSNDKKNTVWLCRKEF